MESTAYIKNVKSTPKKLRLLLPNVKKLSPVQALEVLRYMPKKSAKDLGRAIASAVSNAKSALNLPEHMLQFKTVLIEEGQKLKRFKAGSKGSPKPIVRRYAHIKITLTGVKVDNKKSIVNELKTENKKEVIEKESKAKTEKKVKSTKVIKAKA